MARKALVIFLALALAASSLSAAVIDLGSGTYYARRGFDPATISREPEPGSGGWIAVQRDRNQGLAVRDFGLPGLSPPGLLDFRTSPPEDFTILRVFWADRSVITTPGISIIVPQAGQAWALYLNGDLIHDEIAAGADGRPRAGRTLRDTIVSLDKRSLRLGANVLAFHIVGDPKDEATGLASSRPLAIDSYAALSRKGLEYLDIALIGVYALFAIYHLILFALRPRHPTYVVYAVAALLFSAFIFARTQTAAALVPDTSVLLDIEDASLFLSLPCFMAFIELALAARIGRVPRAGFAASLVLAALLPFLRHEPLRLLWEVLALAQLVFIFAFRLVPGVLARARGDEKSRRPGLGELLGSDEFLLFLSTLVFAGAAVGDILVVSAGVEPFIAKYAFLAFVLGSAAILAGQFNGVYTQLERLGSALERKVAERSAQLADAIERQRHLGEEIEHKRRRLVDAADEAERDLALAARVQGGFFPSEAPKVEGWDLGLAWRPAGKVSGGFFDFYRTGARLEGLVLGASSGEGMGAGLVAVLARAVFGRLWTENRGLPLGELLALVHAELESEIGAAGERLSALVLRVEDGKVEYANAAHPDLLYRRSGSDSAVALMPRGREDLRGPTLAEAGSGGTWTSIRFQPGQGDLILAASPCLAEARNREGERFGRDRLLAALSRAGDEPAGAVLQALVREVEDFRGSKGFEDDLTAILLKRT